MFRSQYWENLLQGMAVLAKSMNSIAEENWEVDEDELHRRKDKFFELFSEYFYYLWD